MKTTKKKLIAFIAKPLELLVHREWSGPEIRCDIGTHDVDAGDRSPRNWRLDYDEPKTSTGGCFARIFASQAYANSPSVGIFSQKGPEISYGDLRDYEHAARALKRIDSRMESIRSVRGPTLDAADSIGRWLEACGVSEVWIAAGPMGNSLSGCDWHVLAIGAAVYRIREVMPERASAQAGQLAIAG